MTLLEKCWYRPGIWTNFLVYALLPLSWSFCAIAILRRKSYQLNLKKSYSASVPVVVIGNIVVGGSGKTPLLISICELIKEEGFRPGVVSRGYGGSVTGVRQLQDNDLAAQVGDEPLMIYQRTNVPVVVGVDRVAAVDFLLKNNQCDIVLSDDGLQHYRMQRNIEIAVIDSSRRLGNEFCLPAGPLRERASRLNDVDLVVYSGENSEECSYSLKVVKLSHLHGDESATITSFTGKTVRAVAGIGNPSRFFEQLRDNGIVVIEQAFSDHHGYAQKDFSGWHNDCIIMTEKDAVKCRHLQLPDAWVLSVAADYSKSLELQLRSKILPLLSQKN